jgi:peptidoglycan/xylan/chitin deacetylase (PgdA/CDA1 family)
MILFFLFPKFSVSDANDDPSGASTLTLGTRYYAYIDPSGDVDWAKFYIPGAGEINILFEVPSGLDYDVELYDSSAPNGYLDGSYNGTGQDETINYTVSSGGWYYIKRYGYSGDYSSTSYYITTANFTEEIQSLELIESSCYISPSSRYPGSRFTLYYRVYNPNSSSVPFGLGASIRPASGGTWMNDENDDVNKTISGNTTATFYRYFDILDSACPGSYTVAYGLHNSDWTSPMHYYFERNDLTVNLQSPSMYDISPNPSYDGNYYVSWTDISYSEGYELLWSTDPTVPDNTSPGMSIGNNYLDVSQQPDGVYYYKVRAVKCFEYSSWSNIESVTVQTNPDPDLQSVSGIPSSINLGNSFTMSVSAENEGGVSPAGYISISYTNNPSLTNETGSGLTFTQYPPGYYPIYDKNGNAMTAQNKLLDALDSSWTGNESHTMSVTVTPQQTGTMYIYVRTNMQDNDSSTYFTDCSVSGGDGFFVDQQGWMCRRFPVDVVDLRPAISTFVINNDATTTTNQVVTLNNTCTNSPTLYMASENSSFSGASWLTYSNSPNFSLSAGYGPKRVYFKVKNNYGECELYAYDDIELIPPPPNITGITPSAGPREKIVTISGSNFGDSRGSSYVKFGTAVVDTGKYWNWSNTSIQVDVPANVSLGTLGVIVHTGDGDSNSWNFYVQSNPSPSITINGLPDSVEEGESFTFDVILTDNGGDADRGGLAVSFPDLTQPHSGMLAQGPYDTGQARVETVSTSFPASTVRYFDQGDGLLDPPDSTAQHLLVDCDTGPFSGVKSITLRVTPQQINDGVFSIRIRGFLGVGGPYGYGTVYRSPNNSGTGIEQDQQYYWAYIKNVNIGSGPKIVDKSLSTSTARDGSTITIGYRINNPTGASLPVGLGCSIIDPAEKEAFDITNDITITAQTGTNWYYRDFIVNLPPGAQTGTYDVAWGIWEIVNGERTELYEYVRDQDILTIQAANTVRVPILMYHKIGQTAYSQYWVTTGQFRTHMEALKAYGYTAVTLQDILDYRAGLKTVPAKPILIIMDDGYKNLRTEAYPIISDSAINYKVTAFLPTGRLGGDNSWDELEVGEPVIDHLTWDDVQFLHNSGYVDCQSHTVTHPHLFQLNETELKSEFENSRQAIETHLNKTVKFIGWPFCEHNDTIGQIAYESGYFAAAACDNAIETTCSNKWALKRVTISSDIYVDYDEYNPGNFFMTKIEDPDVKIPLIQIDSIEYLDPSTNQSLIHNLVNPGSQVKIRVTATNSGESADVIVSLNIDSDSDHNNGIIYDSHPSEDNQATFTTGQQTFEWIWTVPNDAPLGQYYVLVGFHDQHYVLGYKYEGWLNAFSVTNGPINQTPSSPASDISNQPSVMMPGPQYSITAKYYDLDGCEDIHYCYLRIDHPTGNDLTMCWDQNTNNYFPWSGQNGSDYLTLNSVESTVLSDPFPGYEVTWTFSLNSTWQESGNGIRFGVYVEDDFGLVDGWNYDTSDSSFTRTVSIKLPVPYYNQSGTKWCGPTSLAMLLKYYDIRRQPWQIADSLDYGPGEYFTGLNVFQDVDQIMNEVGVSYLYDWAISQIAGIPFWPGISTLDDFLIARITAGHPVMLASTEIEHAFLVVGFNDDYVYINDPSGACLEALGIDAHSKLKDLAGYPVTWDYFHSKLLGSTWGIPIFESAIFHAWSIEDNSLTTIEPQNSGTISVLSARVKSLLSGSHGSGADYHLAEMNWDGEPPHEGYYFNAQYGTYDLDPVLGAKLTRSDFLSLMAVLSNPDTDPRQYVLQIQWLNSAQEVLHQFEFPDVNVDRMKSNVDVPLFGTTEGEYPIVNPNTESGSPGVDDDDDGLIDENIHPIFFSLSQMEDGQYFLKLNLIKDNTTIDSINFRIIVEGGPTCVSPGITTQPQDQSIDYYNSATLNVVATGTPQLNYQWYQGTAGDTTVPVGSDSGSFTTPNLIETTNYWVRVSNSCGSVDSSTATISVIPPEVSILSLSPDHGPVNTDVTITGSNFGTSQGTVTFNGVNAVINNWTNTQIQTVVPTEATTGPVIVQTIEGFYSNAVDFTVEPLVQTTINFAGKTWNVKSGQGGPGNAVGIPNNWSNTTENVWVDSEGKLHLRITKRNGEWYCAEIFSQQSFGRGKYTFYIEGRPDLFEEHVVLGLFTYLDIDGDDNIEVAEGDGEIDIEFSKWGNVSSSFNTQYVLQPCDWTEETLDRFFMDLNGEYSTHYFVWDQDEVRFTSIHGHYDEPPNNDYLIWNATISGANVPTPSDEKVHLNLWLYKGYPPTDDPIEIVISDFQFEPLDCTQPSITSHPQSQTIPYGESVQLSVQANGTLPLSFQWYLGASSDTSNPISGATSSTYQTPNLTATTNYWVRVSNACGTEDSNTATITVETCIPPTITTHPQSQTIPSGESVQLSVQANGTLPLSFQWYLGASGDTSNPISGATSSTYQTPNLTATTNYWVRVSNICGTTDSDTAVITIEACGSPAITSHPQSQTIPYGESVQLSVQANGTLPLSFQWYLGASGDTSNPISGATSGTYQTPNLTATANYWVRVSNACGTVDSNTAIITVEACGSPAITSHPQSQTISSGESAQLSVQTNGTLPLSFQWYLGVSGDTSNPISGATSSTYQTPNLTATTNYWVRVSNACGTVDSNTAIITVEACGSPAITSHPQSQTIPYGESAQLSVQANGTLPLSFQWYLGASGDTSNPISGATSSTYQTPNLTATTNYWVRVSNACGTVDSNTAIITVETCNPPIINTHPESQVIQSGETANLFVEVSGDTPFTYRWYQGTSGNTETPIGNNSSQFTSPVLTETTDYWVRVTNSCDSTDSTTATITVGSSISGCVVDSSGNGIENIGIYVYDLEYDFITSVLTDTNGNFSVQDISEGDYKLYFSTTNAGNYFDEWYNNKGSFDTAEIVHVTPGQTTYVDDVQLVEYQDDIYEQNDTIDKAKEIDAGIYGNLECNDPDWFKISVPEGKILQVYLTRTSGSGWLHLSIRESNHNFLDGKGTSGSDMVTWVGPLNSGYHFIEIYYSNGTYSYSMDVKIKDASEFGSISGRATDGISGLEGVNVRITYLDEHYWEVQYSDSNGEFSQLAAPGGYKIRFEATGNYIIEYYNNKFTSEEADVVNVTAGSTTTLDEIILEEGGIINGRVTDSSGAGVSSVYVEVFDMNNDYICYNTTDLNGDYIVNGIPPGNYKVHFDPRWSGNYISEWYNDQSSFDNAETISVTSGQTTTLTDAVLAEGGIISGRVTDGINGIEGVRVMVYDLSYRYIDRSIYTDSNGDYTLQGIPSGNYKVKFYTTGDFIGEWYNDKISFDDADAVSVTEGQTTILSDTVLEIGGIISGRVTDGINGIEDVRVRIYDLDYNSVGSSIYTDSNGDYTIQGIAGGSYKIRFYTTGNFFGEWYNDKNSFDDADVVLVTAGQTTTLSDAVLVEGGMISGRVTDGTNGIAFVHINLYNLDYQYVASIHSDINGNYTIPGLPNGNYKLSIAGTGNFIGEWYNDKRSFDDADTILVVASQTTVLEEVVLAEGGFVSGRVSDSQGAGIYNVFVYVYDLNYDYLCEGHTDNNGEYTIQAVPPGDCKVYFYAYRAGNYISEWYNDKGSFEDADTVSVTPGQTASLMDTVLAEGGTISGRVTDGANGIEGVWVYVYDLDYDYLYSVDTDNNGNYSIPALASGGYKVRIASSGYYIGEWYNDKDSFYAADVVSVTAGETTTLPDVVLGEGGTISGRVTDSPGNGLDDVYVRIYDLNETYLGSGWTDGNGNYTVQAVPPGDWLVYFDTRYAGNYVPEWYNDRDSSGNADTVAVTAGQTTTLSDAVLAEGGMISGRATDGTDGIEDIRIYVYDPDYNSISYTYSDSNGNYTIAGLASGDYKVRFYSSGNFLGEWYNDKGSFDDADVVSVTVGQTTTLIDTVLSESGGISGKVTDGTNGIEDVWVRVFDLNNHYISYAYTDNNGDYTVQAIPTGNFKVRFYSVGNFIGEWYEDKTSFAEADPIPVIQGQTTQGIDVELALGGSISGNITDMAGAPIYNIVVDVYDLAGNHIDNDYTDRSGDYRVPGISEGSYKVLFDPAYQNTFPQNYGNNNYVYEWYDNKTSFNDADTVNVVVDQITGGIDATIYNGGSITGEILDESGNGIKDIMVMVFSESTHDLPYFYYAYSDYNGLYEVRGLPTGNYLVVFRAGQGYAGEFFNDVLLETSATLVPVTVGSITTGINATLIKSGTVSGRVTDASGVGIEHVLVRLYDSSNNKYLEWLGNSDFTDSNGNFEIPTASSGQRKISFQTYDVIDGNFIGEFYNDKQSVVDADIILVQPEGTVSGINAVLSSGGGTISGYVKDSNETPLAGAQIDVYDSQYETYMAYGSTDNTGYFEIVGLIPGNYKLFIQFRNILPAEWYSDKTDFATANIVNVTDGGNTQIISILGGNDPVIDPVTISGIVTTYGIPLNGVEMTGLPGEPMTDTSGYYEAAVNTGWYGTVTPTLTGYTFTEPSTTYENVMTDQVTNYTAVYNEPITVTAPNGGEDWEIGSIENITWSGAEAASNVRIEYSIDSGISWSEIVTSTANDGIYEWTIPDNPSNHCLVRVRVNDSDEGPSDINDTLFSIVYNSFSCGKSWSTANYSGSDIFNAVAYGNSRFVGVGIGGVIQTSTDGINWSAQSPGNDNDLHDLHGIVFGNNKFVAVGNAGMILTSPDGISWTTQSSGTTTQINAVTYDSGKFVAVGDNGIILTSPDGIGWTTRSSGTNAVLSRITFGSDKFVAVGIGGIILTSPDGIGWTLRSSGTNNSLYGIAYGNSQFAAVGSAGVILTSPDGINWNSRNSIVTTDLISAGYGNSTFVIVGMFGEILTSTGGIDWTNRYSGVGNDLFGIAYGNSRFVAGGEETILYSICGAVSPAITITSPNGGENWQVDSIHEITWTSSGAVGDVKIEYSTDSGTSWIDITSVISNDGNYEWTLPNSPSANCLIRISEADGEPTDISDTLFAIITEPEPTITLTSPNGAESLTAGTEHQITWTSTGNVGDVKIDYSMNSGGSWINIITAADNDGSYDWTIPDTPSDNCLIRIIGSETDGGAVDISDSEFSIVSTSAAKITVTSPNGGESLTMGSTHEITWASTGTVGSITIEYSSNRSTAWTDIVSSTDNDGSYAWEVPETPSDNCLIRISESDKDEGPVDISDSSFSIIPSSAASIRVDSPDGGERLPIGSIHDITWTCTGTVNDVTIEYSIDNSSSWNVIADNTTNDGHYAWTVPDNPSESCLIRVSETDGEPSDTSDSLFSIVIPASITLISPNGGESWEAGSMQSINWTSTGMEEGEEVRIEYSTDSGTSWTNVGISTGESGSFSWRVPDTPSEHCLLRISESDTDEGSTDISDFEFAIVPATSTTIYVTSPNGGETWEAGYYQNITWISTGSIGNVKIEYSTDGGTSWTEISTSTENDGIYEWIIPDNPSINCLIQVSEIDGDPVDVSDIEFSIVSSSNATITVISPNGGETLAAESTHEITWTSTGTINSVIIEYSTDNGTSWTNIVTSTANDGSYIWPVPSVSSKTCLLRITASDIDGDPSDMSDEVFEINEDQIPSITVISPNGAESLTIGSSHEISWVSSGIDNNSNVIIEYSTNNGANWTGIAEVLVSESCYLWLIPDTPSNDCLVRIGLEGTDESPVDVSDSIFSIISDTPSCGETWSTAVYSGTGKFTSVTYDGSKFAAVGKGGVIMTSYNGKKWLVQSSGVTNDLNGIIYGDNKFAAVGAGGLILTSSDGTNWIDQYPGADNELRGIAYGNNMFAGVGVGGLILTSLDGIAWQVQSPGIAVDFRGITYGNNKFVAVGDRGTIMTSIDGINWSKRSSWTTNTLYGITFGDNKFLAVGESGVILSSSDGVNWNSRTSSVSMNLLNVGQGNSTFVIVGEYGEILTSHDGINWISRCSGVRNNLTGIACTESLFVVVGVETILYSLCE